MSNISGKLSAILAQKPPISSEGGNEAAIRALQKQARQIDKVIKELRENMRAHPADAPLLQKELENAQKAKQELERQIRALQSQAAQKPQEDKKRTEDARGKEPDGEWPRLRRHFDLYEPENPRSQRENGTPVAAGQAREADA